jgi:hypothetical protein
MGWGQAWGGHGQEGKLTTIFYLSYHLSQIFFTVRYLLTCNLLHTRACQGYRPGERKDQEPEPKDEACRNLNRQIGKQLKIMPVESVKKNRGTWAEGNDTPKTRAERQMKILPMEIVKRETWVKESDCWRGRRITRRRRGQETVGLGKSWRWSWPLKS